ncbi:bifunctional folylpolyglutamate synthase/dihydrofolate synthase [Bacilli bacterium]|nr:bifunctional folylpolyglutamate synthase/dihydrofolate synthase [Bacilli bacterium]
MKLPKWPEPSSINRIYLGLERILELLEKLGHPERKMPPVFHVAGTNGKGSVTAFLKCILEENGYVVHRNISPHLVRFNERIEIAGKEIDDEYYDELASECKYTLEKYDLNASYFEIIVAIAIMAFSRNGGDATIFEVGMGGRLDATNIIEHPLVSVITPISLDHTKVLGDTVEKIAMEKIAIAKKGTPVVVSKQPASVVQVMREAVKSLGSPLYNYGIDWKYTRHLSSSCSSPSLSSSRMRGSRETITTAWDPRDKPEDDRERDHCEFSGFGRNITTSLPSLEGNHQIINAGTAIAALLCQNRLTVTDYSIQNGVQKAFWKARLQNLKGTKLYDLVDDGSELYLDGGHNEGGARVLVDWLEEKNAKEKRDNILIICMLKKKDTKAFIKEIGSRFRERIVISNKNEDYKEADEFIKEFEEIGLDVYGSCENIESALKMTRNIHSINKKRILVCGSLYFCGEVLSLIEGFLVTKSV